jgi:DNA-binding MarR family transcriptional regulator
LRELLGLTDGNLGTHLTALEKAGYVLIEKLFVGKKPRTRLALSREGRRAFDSHVQYLRDIIDASG